MPELRISLVSQIRGTGPEMAGTDGVRLNSGQISSFLFAARPPSGEIPIDICYKVGLLSRELKASLFK